MKRFFEILPGAIAWLTIVLMFLLSWRLPVWVSVFIILFDIYWLLKTIFLSLHLRAAFNEMKRVMKIDWIAELRRTEISSTDLGGGSIVHNVPTSWRDIRHLIILPMYDEPYAVVRESFESLLRSHYPKENMIVVLGLEERAGAVAQDVGERIRAEFGGEFGALVATTHPAQLPGEIPGKGANETWAALRAKEAVIDAQRIPHEKIIVSVFDIDTQVFPEYFSRLTHVFLNTSSPLRAIYQPIPLFTNNIFEAPALARVVAFSTTFWQMMQQSRPERLTSFSSQSIPFATLVDLGFWHRDIVSEDSRIFWQGYAHYHGDFRVEPLFYPVSMDANVARTFWGTMVNIYKQQRRWAWGVENTPYILEAFRTDPLIPRRKKWYWTFVDIEGRWSWATNSLLIFALGWLPVLLGGAHFGATVLAYNLPRITRWIITISAIGIVSSAVLAIILLPEKSGGKSAGDYTIYFLQWILMPLTLIIFGAFPGLDAQTRLALGGRARLGFWVTPKSRRAAKD